MKIIQDSWKQEMLIGIDSIILKDGTLYRTGITSSKDIRAKEAFNRSYVFRIKEKTSLKRGVSDDPDLWSEFQARGKMDLSDNSTLLFGECEMGNEGFIVKLDVHDNLEWSFFSTQSNPFMEARMINDEINVFSTHGFSIVVKDHFNPLSIEINNHLSLSC